MSLKFSASGGNFASDLVLVSEISGSGGNFASDLVLVSHFPAFGGNLASDLVLVARRSVHVAQNLPTYLLIN